MSLLKLKLNEQSCLNGSSPGALSDFCHDISTTTILGGVPLFSEGTSAHELQLQSYFLHSLFNLSIQLNCVFYLGKRSVAQRKPSSVIFGRG